MRRLVPSVGVVAAWLALAAVLPAVGLAQTFVKPGDAGQIEFPIESATDSAAPAEGVEITVEAPAHFVVKGTSIKGPDTIPPAETKTFVVDYEIAADAPEGSFTATLKVGMTTENVDPDPSDPASFTVVDFVDLLQGESHSHERIAGVLR